jgi:hypothetical protein
MIYLHMISVLNGLHISSYKGRPPRRGPRTLPAGDTSPSPRIFWHLRSAKAVSRRLTVLTSPARIDSRGCIGEISVTTRK